MSALSSAISSHNQSATTQDQGHQDVLPEPMGPQATSNPSTPYSVYSQAEKWIIVILTAVAGLFSPLTANIYFPAIPTLSRAFNKSTELINLTVTMYMALQGTAPMLWGTLSDQVGRRPIYAACLLVLSLSCVGLALVPTSAYWLLMVLRCFQAAGSASTIAIGAGVIGDISTRAERGGFLGIFTLGPMFGPAIGPVIGGALSDHLGWRSIFWFLCISSSVCLVAIILFLPETLRVIVGNGSTKPKSFVYTPIIPVIGRGTETQAARKETKKAFRNPLRLLLQLDLVLLLFISAIACALFYGVLATISTQFTEIYPSLDETRIGLCFLAIGGGTIIGSSANGRFLDWEYARLKAKTLREQGEEMDASFPIEKARLRALPLMSAVFVAVCAGYGWCIQEKVNIVGPLVLQILVGFIAIAVMNSIQTLMIDLVPTQSSSVTACNNLIRCTLSAVVVATIEPITKAVGAGWTYIILAGLGTINIPLVYLAVTIGPRSRARRQQNNNAHG